MISLALTGFEDKLNKPTDDNWYLDSLFRYLEDIHSVISYCGTVGCTYFTLWQLLVLEANRLGKAYLLRTVTINKQFSWMSL
jgi:ABC-type uncharacterized transport system YnjBCD substrate-binding protein